MHGYCQQLLHVDLTSRTITTLPLDEGQARLFIGASGLAARLYVDLALAAGARPQPLGPDNPLIVLTGPLQATSFPGSGRFSVAARSPLTGLWGEANCGGDFGPFLKYAGFDGVICTGEASEPLLLWIEDGRAELQPAAGLWGQDTYETADELWRQGGKGTKVLCIGPAGERGVRYAAIVSDKGDVAGRTGLGAVMGAKKLKAIVARGSRQITVADLPAYQALRSKVQHKIRDMATLQGFKSFGTAGGLYYSSMVGDVAARNWQSADVDEQMLLGLDGTTMADTILTGNDACYACPVACKRRVAVSDGPFATPEGPGPEYETVAAFGLLSMNGDLQAVAKANELCNRLGLDTISCGATIAFVMEATERGLIDSGLPWGDAAAIVGMVEKIGRREGLGDVLAEGVLRVAERIGVAPDADWLPHVKGLEVPMHDPRAFHGIAVGYATTPRGANHNGANVYAEMGSVVYPEVGLDGDLTERKTEGKAYLSAMSQYIGGIVDALTLCFFDGWAYTLDDMAQALNSVTGLSYDVEELMRCGERIWALKRSINTLFGATAGDDRLPRRFLTPLNEGPTAGTAPDFAAMLREFYSLTGLDKEGRVTRDRLDSLGMPDIAAFVHG
jgi:aldehyde:ferredoxin oxidoreductase